jgi:hypothetical protein
LSQKPIPKEKQAWLLWLVCTVQFDGEFTHGVGEGADEVAFIDPETLKDA